MRDDRRGAEQPDPNSGKALQFAEGGQEAPRFSIMQVTPETAPSLLALKRPGVRRNQSAVAAYAQAMQSGEWVLNGMPLIVSRKGVLLDGVQRLYACIEAAVPFVTVLAENVSDDTVHTIDQQRRRSFSGVLETRGIRH
ncbi:MAG TPA: ParB/RepB/Spo0J family partition protein, partial [Acetobacteraceae bacterium]|nr:ParB/RepB/Spo0J family partition protein [Acetobacteraceae bacterium]